MKKTIIVGSTIVAFFLSICLLGMGVFAVVGKSFGISNSIVFNGSTNLAFELSGEVTGTANDGDDSLSFVWDYEKETSPTDYEIWELPNLVFLQDGRDVGDSKNPIKITYSFSIKNKSKDLSIKAYIGDMAVDRMLFDVYINNRDAAQDQEIIIGKGQTKNLVVELIPTVQFEASKSFEFTVYLESVE